MKKSKLIAFACITFAATSCGSGDTGEGYPTDTSGLNTNPAVDSTVAPAAGARGNPDSTIGATTNTKAPDSNATNPNIR